MGKFRFKQLLLCLELLYLIDKSSIYQSKTLVLLGKRSYLESQVIVACIKVLMWMWVSEYVPPQYEVSWLVPS